MILRNCKITIQEKKYDGLKIYMFKFILKRKKDQSADSLSLPVLFLLHVRTEQEGSHLQVRKRALTRS